jgi:hypothetical protein
VTLARLATVLFVVAGCTLASSAAAQLPAEHTNAMSPPVYLETEIEGFHVSYHPSARERVRRLVAELPLVRRELEGRLGVSVLSEVSLEVAASPDELWHGAAGGSGDALRIASKDARGEAVDLLAAARFSLARRAFHEAGGALAPTWFETAFAEYFSLGVGFGETRTLAQLAWNDRLPSIDSLAKLDLADCVGGCSEERAAARDLARFVAGHDRGFERLTRELQHGASFETALERASSVPEGDIQTAWHQETARRHMGFVAALGVLAVATTLGVWRFLARRAGRARAAVSATSLNAGVWLRESKSRVHRRVNPRSRGQHERHLLATRTKSSEIPKVEHDGNWHTLH